MANNKTEFFTKYYELAKVAGERYGIAPAVILSQAAIESAYGTSFSVKNRNNFFGITAFGTTNKHWKGRKSQSTTSKLWFRIYDNPQDSFLDFARLIKSKYPDAANVSHSITDYASTIANSNYINEGNGDNRTNYESMLVANGKVFLDLIKKKDSQSDIVV